MNNDDFLQLMAKYKFTIAFENAIGDDYITEKLWRPLMLGSVPIYLGSSSVHVIHNFIDENRSCESYSWFNIQDWLPHSNAIVSILHFSSPETLATHLHAINEDDTAYDNMLVHKTKGIVENQKLIDAMQTRRWSSDYDIDDFNSVNFVEAFECFLCSEVYRKQMEEKAGFSSRSSVDTSHYSCSPPIHPVTRKENFDSWWLDHWKHARAEANVIGRLVARNLNYTTDEFHESVFKEISNWLLKSVGDLNLRPTVNVSI